MTENVLNQSEHTSVILVRFRWGNGDELLLTDAGEEKYTGFSSDPFLADQRLKVTLPARSGGLGEGPARIRFSQDLAIFGRQVSSGKAFPKVTVDIWELADSFEPGRFQQKILYLFRGTAVAARRNPEGERGVVELACLSPKDLLDVSAGFQANAECGNSFGQGGCTVDVAALSDSGSVTSINRNIVNITGLSSQTDNRYWRRGWVKRGGLAIQIREWDGGTVFDLSQLPPEEWKDQVALGGAAVSVFPGCDLLRKTCRDVWDNEVEFNGLAFATPPYNPIFENPEQ